jgi:hypothetical protein
MLSESERDEYLAEIREQVCSRCVERPADGPPCEPLGKLCGIEMHLPEIIDSVHHVRSNSVIPYLEMNRNRICERCALLHSSICPCPMDYMAVLLVRAIDTVDRRRAERAMELATVAD